MNFACAIGGALGSGRLPVEQAAAFGSPERLVLSEDTEYEHAECGSHGDQEPARPVVLVGINSGYPSHEGRETYIG